MSIESSVFINNGLWVKPTKLFWDSCEVHFWAKEKKYELVAYNVHNSLSDFLIQPFFEKHTWSIGKVNNWFEN